MTSIASPPTTAPTCRRCAAGAASCSGRRPSRSSTARSRSRSSGAASWRWTSRPPDAILSAGTGQDMNRIAVADWSALKDRAPAYALVGNVDLVIIRYGDNVSVLYGRCLHRGALLADGRVDGDNLICGL